MLSRLFSQLESPEQANQRNDNEISHLVELNTPSAQYRLGMIYHNGMQSISRDDRESLHWFYLSAQNGNSEAQYMLGSFYEYGYGIQKDMNEAIYWYELSAEKGNKHALLNLGGMYLLGIKVAKNHDRGIELLYQAAKEQQFPEAQYKLGRLYVEGEYIQKDLAKSFYWLQLAAENGHHEASYYLSYAYYDGIGTEKNIIKAKEWFTKYCKKGVKMGNGKYVFPKDPKCYKDGTWTKIGIWSY